MLISENPIPEKYKSDHLFLLIGENPLPLYISALLLTEDGSTIYLLHSDGSEDTPSTKPFAELLMQSLIKEHSKTHFLFYGLDQGNSAKIQAAMKRILSGLKLSDKSRIGLNYTGGTKPMAIHSHLILGEQFPNTVFSYLDAHKLAMQIEAEPNPIKVNDAIELSLEDVTQLHGYKLQENYQLKPRHIEFAKALAEVHQRDEGISQWQQWYDTLDKLSPPILPDIINYPALKPIIDAFNEVCNASDQECNDKIAQELGFKKIKSATKWFISEWLEDLALQAIIDNTKKFTIKHYAEDICAEPVNIPHWIKEAPKFQVDAAAMLGYQLFYFSCIVSSPGREEKSEVKKHFFEAYVRARQLGGDEARAALIGTSKVPGMIQHEIEREWSAWGRIRVFGRTDLLCLSNTFRQWFEEKKR